MAIARKAVPASDVAWQVLDAHDIDAVYALHLAAIGQIGRPDLIRPETRAFFEMLLAGGGKILGLADADGLLAYGVLQWDLPPAENLRPLFGLAPDAPFAKLAGAAVRPGSWGRGLQESVIAARVTLAASLGLTHLYATSAPGNWRSWTNLLNRGFAVRALIEQYGGMLRYIVYRDLDAAAGAGDGGEGTWVEVADTETQQRLLGDNRIGAAWRRVGDDRHEILYRTPA